MMGEAVIQQFSHSSINIITAGMRGINKSLALLLKIF